MSETPIFDQEILKQQVLGNEELMKMIIGTFLDDGVNQMRAVDEAIAAADGEQIHRACHRLKGSTSSVGAMVMTPLVLEMERLAKQDDLEQVKALQPQLQQAFDDLVVAMRAVV
ncbi:Hpt domain-containing protein [Ectothiorhodospiraceae bacterium BW-2]|nr:Hpt domain-containing protein [Ectothiorhodospiraceae bacterium BW-2]